MSTIFRSREYETRQWPSVSLTATDAVLAFRFTTTPTRSLRCLSVFSGGEQTSIGAGKRGRVWSNLRLRVSNFSEWCKQAGEKIANDEIEPEEVLKGTLIPRMVMARPSTVAIGVDWPVQLIDFNESVTAFSFEYISEVFTTHVGLELVEYVSVKPA